MLSFGFADCVSSILLVVDPGNLRFIPPQGVVSCVIGLMLSQFGVRLLSLSC